MRQSWPGSVRRRHARQDCGASRAKHTHGNGDFKPNSYIHTYCHRNADFKPNIHINTDSHCDAVSLLPTRLPATGAEVKSGRPFDLHDLGGGVQPVWGIITHTMRIKTVGGAS